MNSEQVKNIKKLFTLILITVILYAWLTALFDVLNHSPIVVLSIMGMMTAIIKKYVILVLEE